MSILRNTNANINQNELGFDAWGRNKMITDYSLFHGLFTFNIPPEMWIKYKNGAEDQTIADTADFYSENGKGVINSNGGDNLLLSRRNARYQPNRGHLYSASQLLPDPNAQTIRRWGLFHEKDGVFFELDSGILYAVVRSSFSDFILDEDGAQMLDELGAKIEGTDSSPQETRVAIDFGAIDLGKGNIYDIQMQWRGVGNIKFFINNELVHTFEFLGTLGQLSISNPALPIAMQAINKGEDANIECGCCDVTSEGGKRETRFYQTVDSDELSVSSNETPLIAFRIPSTYNGELNTRDVVLTRISAFCDANALLKVYYTRDVTAITATWSGVNNGFQEVAIDGEVTAFDINKMRKLATRRIPENGNIEIDNPDKQSGDFFLIHGDYILVTVKAKNNTSAGSIIEYSVEI